MTVAVGGDDGSDREQLAAVDSSCGVDDDNDGDDEENSMSPRMAKGTRAAGPPMQRRGEEARGPA
uniref:Uncharacterized protein n=1 Tax=Oryza brachyantha TaxID=4533 RepID=J3L2F4_ORYBR